MDVKRLKTQKIALSESQMKDQMLYICRLIPKPVFCTYKECKKHFAHLHHQDAKHRSITIELVLMNDKPKIPYQKAEFLLQNIELENCISAASASVTPGGSNTSQPWNPEIDNWTEVGDNDRTFDL